MPLDPATIALLRARFGPGLDVFTPRELGLLTGLVAHLLVEGKSTDDIRSALLMVIEIAVASVTPAFTRAEAMLSETASNLNPDKDKQ